MFCRVWRMASAVRKASERVSLRLALSSSVLSNHCAACVWYALPTRVMRCLASAHARSLRIGLRLYGMADEPI